MKKYYIYNDRSEEVYYFTHFEDLPPTARQRNYVKELKTVKEKMDFCEGLLCVFIRPSKRKLLEVMKYFISIDKNKTPTEKKELYRELRKELLSL